MNQKTMCNLCPRKCNIDRQKLAGFCGANNTLKIGKVMLHYFEEPIISGDDSTEKQGSGAIFFSHCSLKCNYCQNHEISSGGLGKEISIQSLANLFKQLEDKGATNINLVSPTHYTNQIIEALKIYRPNIPIVWNTSGYETIETLKKLKGYVDIYLTDYKYSNSTLAKEYSLAENYPVVIKDALMEMRAQLPEDIIEKGLMKKGIIIRHMLLPNATQNALDIFENIKNMLGENTIISVMSQYTPFFKAIKHDVLKNKIKPIEYKICENYLKKYNFKNVYLQDLTSANSKYTPDFKTQKSDFDY